MDTDEHLQVDQSQYIRVPDDDPDDFERVQAVNTTGMLNVCRAVAKVMATQEPRQFTTSSGTQRDLGRGVMATVTSAAALAGIPAKVAYTTSKWASLGMTKTLGKNRCVPHDVEANVHLSSRPSAQGYSCEFDLSDMGRYADVRG